MKFFYFFNGKFRESSRALLLLNDLGLLRGYGVFDYFCTYKRRPFCMNAYWRRFRASAATVNLKLPFDYKNFQKIIAELLVKNKHIKGDLGLRMVLTGGLTKDYRTAVKPNFFIIVDKSHCYPEKNFQKGVKIITLPYRRQLPEIKTLNYLAAVSHWQKVIQEQAVEILYVFRGRVLEAATSNVFIVKNGIVLTPKKSILDGVTRQIVVWLAKKEGIKIKFVSLRLKEVLRADECFITATDKGVMPVVKIDDCIIGSGLPGEQTKRFMKLFQEFKLSQMEISN